MPLSHKNSYVKYNALPENPNMYPETVYNIFKKLNIIEQADHTLIVHPEWISQLVEINDAVIQFSTLDEISYLDLERVKPLLKANMKHITLEKQRAYFCLIPIESEADLDIFKTHLIKILESRTAPLVEAIRRSSFLKRQVVINYALVNSRKDYAFATTLLAPQTLDPEILAHIMRSTDAPSQLIDTVLPPNTSLPSDYINSFSTVPKQHRASPLMLAAAAGALENVRRLLAYENIKTALKYPITGKTALHYAVEMAVLRNPTQNATLFQKTERFQIIKLLLDKNPALADIQDAEGRRASSSLYTTISSNNRHYLRKYLKSRESGWFTRKHKNTNLNQNSTRKNN
jgi:hypothetical protein